MTVQGAVKKQQPDGMSHRGAAPSLLSTLEQALWGTLQSSMDTVRVSRFSPSFVSGTGWHGASLKALRVFARVRLCAHLAKFTLHQPVF